MKSAILAAMATCAFISTTLTGCQMGCETDTGGSCKLLPCSSHRNAQCVEGRCVCENGACAVDGVCTGGKEEPVPEPTRAPDPFVALAAKANNKFRDVFVFMSGVVSASVVLFAVSKRMSYNRNTPLLAEES